MPGRHSGASRFSLLLFFVKIFLVLNLVKPSWAIPPLPYILNATPALFRRSTVVENRDGQIVVIDSDSLQFITQGPASDGSGSGFNAAAVIWVLFTFVNGVPLTIAGIRGSRISTAAAAGLAFAACGWAAMINTMGVPDIGDVALTLIVLGMYAGGFMLGLFSFARTGCIALLCLEGGAAVGIRAVIMKDDLLISTYVVNWVLVVLTIVASGLLSLFKQRIAILLSVASCGTFLTGLGIDLILHKQDGMSRGLRFLFDRNSAHLADLIGNGYYPTLSTTILIGISLAVIPIAAFAQHKIFTKPFYPTDSEDEETLEDLRRRTVSKFFDKPPPSRFSM
ncbi:hypothetical protein NEOLEDRAFT_1137936 [Neolentinus lepideus HHB14362 ss-1]|uniref:TM7S3/TM198-like domain-containing protein n=1 Tax=Neolentinus lepideus HHB14362 ss-1 TaxID=1314782 RepID=A0A165QIJ1_9AGAM|nr:hypothetical protein NEOLEDRAFT_1137936 [Neolentinus lepideus HHB14362 ss-1]